MKYFGHSKNRRMSKKIHRLGPMLPCGLVVWMEPYQDVYSDYSWNRSWDAKTFTLTNNRTRISYCGMVCDANLLGDGPHQTQIVWTHLGWIGPDFNDESRPAG